MSEDGIINSKDVDLATIMVDGVAAVFLLPPVASFTVAAVRSITQLNEDEFKEKLKLFLIAAESPEADKEKFLKLLDKDSDEFFKRLFKVLDRLEDKEKATIIGGLFKAVVKEKFDPDTFKQLSTIIDKTYIGTLHHIRNFEKRKSNRVHSVQTYDYSIQYGYEGSETRQLVGAGLVVEDIKIGDGSTFDSHNITQTSDFRLSDLGILIFEYGLKHISESE